MAPPQFWQKLHVGRSSSANSTLPGNPPSAQPSRSASLSFRAAEATSEESNLMSRSGFQEWRNLPTNHNFATNDTMESEENTETNSMEEWDKLRRWAATCVVTYGAYAASLVRAESEMYSELRKVEGLKKVLDIKIYSKLAANINVAHTFLGLPPEDRAIWLCVEFGSHIFDDPNVPF